MNKKVQERLLETDDLTLSKALKIAKIHETNIEQMKLISSNDVHYVGSRRERNPASRHRYAAHPVKRTDGARPNTWRSSDDAECSKCGRIPTRQTCPAQDKTCHNCGKPNHIVAMCRSTAPTQSAAVRQRRRPQRVHAINDVNYDMLDHESVIDCLTASVNAVHSGGQPYVTLHGGCDSVPMKCKVDTGAEINVLPITVFDKLAESHINRLKPTHVRLTGYSGNVVHTTGTCHIEGKLREKPHTLEFFIAETHATPSLGFDSCRAMELVKIENRILIKLNPDKCVFRTNQVTYFGHIWSADGLRPDPVKTQGIRDIPSPDSREELGTVLGMATYLGQFVPNPSDVTTPLPDLTKKENDFIWDAVSEEAYNSMKQLLCKEPGPVLAYFDPQKDVGLQCDASQKGMGAALLQERHPISYASRCMTSAEQNYGQIEKCDASQKGLGAALLQERHPISYASRCMTSAEQNYAQIEKELLAVVFACERFHQYTYGRDITVQSDHKPLEAITNKPLACAPPRLQRYNVKIVYVPGKQLPFADTLSRIFVKTEPKLPKDNQAPYA